MQPRKALNALLVREATGGIALPTLACVVFILPALISLTGYPTYYEDESWLYLPVFEFLRGNGFSLAALGDKPPSLFIDFSLLTFPFVAVSPFEPEQTVRFISAIADLALLGAILAAARRFSASSASLGPVLLISVPLTFLSLRYGRFESIAAPTAIAALACAAWGRFGAAGLLAGLAVSLHPVQVWVGLPCVMLALRSGSWRPVVGFVVAGGMGILPQALWVTIHIQDIPLITARYFITSSMASGRFGVLASALSEGERYKAYVSSLGWPDLVFQLIVFIGGPLLSMLGRGWFERALFVSIWLGPCLTLALLSQGKNWYYLVSVIPAWTVVSAIGAARLPRWATTVIAIVLLTFTAGRHVAGAIQARQMVQPQEIVSVLSQQLPKGAVVFSELRYAGIFRRRPDLRFFSYHSLSTQEDGWVYPACADMTKRLAKIVKNDTRPSSRNAELPAPIAVNLVWLDDTLLAYLRLIYATIDQSQADCLVEASGYHIKTYRICESGSNCVSLHVSTIPLGTGEAN